MGLWVGLAASRVDGGLNVEAMMRGAQYLERYQLRRAAEESERQLWTVLIGFAIGLTIVIISRLWQAARDGEGRHGDGRGGA